MRAKVFTSGLILTLLSCPASAIGQFEKFYNPPGTRANSMSGAFTAAANDASSLWYNPAGLGNRYGANGDLTIDYGQELVYDTNLALAVNEDRKYKYIGFMGKGANRSSGAMHFGLAYYQPATFAVSNNFGSGTERVDLEYELYTLGIGGGNEVISWGYTIGMAYVNTKFNSAGSSEDYDSELTISGGLILHMIRNPKFKLNGGINWFSGADWSFLDYDSSHDTKLSEVVPAIPKRLSYGINAQFTLPRGLIHVNYDLVEWSTNSDWDSLQTPGTDRQNFGLEAIVPVRNGMMVSIRYGRGTAEETTGSGDTQESSSIGFGIGFLNQHFIDYASETRKLNSNDFKITSLSYSYQF